MDRNMTGLVSLFSRSYHYENDGGEIFADNLARKIITDEEYRNISDNMSAGIQFFNQEFKGNSEEALKWIVNNNLAPSVLARSKFTEDNLRKLVLSEKFEQYLIIGAGYDSFAYRKEEWAGNLDIFEIDRKDVIEDKEQRISKLNYDNGKVNYIDINLSCEDLSGKLTACKNFDKTKDTFISLLGLTYYLDDKSFKKIVDSLSRLIDRSIYVVFDYQLKDAKSNSAGEKQTDLAKAAGEEMLGFYAEDEMHGLLKMSGFKITKEMTAKDIDESYFADYNKKSDIKIKALENVNLCLAVK